MALDDLTFKKKKPTKNQQKLSDGGGLYLLIKPESADPTINAKKLVERKYWKMAYRFDNKQKTLSIGVYPTVTLAHARIKRDEAKKLLADGIDPSEQLTKKAKKADKVKAEKISINTFSSIAREYHGIKSPSWTVGHSKQWLLNMERYAFGKFGDKSITEIDSMDVLLAIRVLETNQTYETRDRLAQSINAVFRFAFATGRIRSNPAADVKFAFAERPAVTNFPCINQNELPEFLRKLSDSESVAKVSIISVTALHLLMLTATRTSEVRFAKWCDFDLDAGLWVIPAEQVGRKGKLGKRKSHTVPLCTQAVDLLRKLYPVTGSREYVFPNRNTHGKVISENTVLKLIELIGYKGRMTGHGFRSLARTILGEMGHRREVLEAMLSHAIDNQTEAAYVRTDYLKERSAIMQQWADYLDGLKKGADVIAIKRAR